MTVAEINNLMTDKEGAGYFCVNKALMRNLGNDDAIVYTELVQSYLYYESKGKLEKGNRFFCMVETLQDRCNVTARQQKPIMNRLEALGLIEVSYSGCPKKRYIKVLANEEAIRNVFSVQPKEHKEKKKMPKEVKEKYSKPFDMDIFKKQINKAAKAMGCEEWSEKVLEVYKIYFGYFGYPETFYSNRSIENVFFRIDDIGLYHALEPDVFMDYCEAYAEVRVEEHGYTRSINNMLSDGMLEVLEQRIQSQ